MKNKYFDYLAISELNFRDIKNKTLVVTVLTGNLMCGMVYLQICFYEESQINITVIVNETFLPE